MSHYRLKPSTFFKLARALGLVNAFRFYAQQSRARRLPTMHPFTLQTPYAKQPLSVRAHTSDIDVFSQIFIDREYACLDDLDEVGLVLDCGANVGYSSAYFLTKWPRCRVICIEPERTNYEMLRHNLREFKDRVTFINAGIWSHQTTLKLSDTKYRGGGKWAIQVEECESHAEGSIPAIDIETILRESQSERISLLKMDIEGAEAIVFSRNYESWLPYVDNLVIEIHDDTHYGNVSNHIIQLITDSKRFAMSTSCEFTVFRQTRRPQFARRSAA